MWVALKPNLGRGLTFINHISGRTRANIMKECWTGGNRFHRQIFLVIFVNQTIAENLMFVTIKIIDGADNVFSLRRKELFWQYRLGTSLPRGLNERAADVELDMFACGMASILLLHFLFSEDCGGRGCAAISFDFV